MEKIILGKKSIEWIATYKRMKSRPYLIPYTKINSKGIKDLNVRPENIKLLEENTGGILFDINLSKIFLDLSPRVMEIKTDRKSTRLNSSH